MKKLLLLTFCVAVMALFIVSCSDENPAESQDNMARIKITAFDAPAPDGIEHLYLNIIEVAIHHEENGWITFSDVDTTIDFLELINGVNVVLADGEITPGHYSQLRLILSDTNEIVVESITYPLTIPSGTQTGVKLNLDFDISAGEFVHLFVDFDVSQSVIVANNQFKLKPTYRVFKEDISGTISGIVSDTLSNPIADVVVEAVADSYQTSTITDEAGAYMLILPLGIYNVSTVLDTSQTADTAYTNIILMAGDSLKGYDFIIQ